VREWLSSAAFSAGWGLVCRLPESVARALFNFGADIAWRRQGGGVQVLEGNLIRVLRTCSGFTETDPEFGQELRALSRAVMRSYARYYLETFRLQTFPDERVQAGMHVNQENVDLTLEHLKNGRGVIYALPHMGDFEQAGRWVILAGKAPDFEVDDTCALGVDALDFLRRTRAVLTNGESEGSA